MNTLPSNGGSSDRQQTWDRLVGGERWDMIVVGGGIIGAAVLREATRAGLKALLLEQNDFSSGTSSRSSKMVHGGLRYIASGDFRITRDSVHERQRLLQQAPGLVEPLRYLFANRKGVYPGRWLFTALLLIYDLFARKINHRFLGVDDVFLQAPHWSEQGMTGACQYTDAATDDARLVLRVLQEAVTDGAQALNYCSVQELQQENDRVTGIIAHNSENGESLAIEAAVVINATGAWADQLRAQVGGEPRVRPLRGSHLVFSSWRFPVYQSITLMHPADKRPVFIFPWEGVTVVGTTDIDHAEDLAQEPHITREEIDYLFLAIDSEFSSLGIEESDVISCYAGIRPVIGTGALNPSAEKRDHCVWDDRGMITVTGGKLTTFRLIALDVLEAAAQYLPGLEANREQERIFTEAAMPESLSTKLGEDQRRRLLGRYGEAIVPWVEAAEPEQLELIPGTRTLWLELQWAAANESVAHLDDLLLRRTRIGLLVADGAVRHMDRIRGLCQPLLQWDDQRWQRELERYLSIWRASYSLQPVQGHN